MEVIAKPRGGGKTTEILKRADNYNGHIVCICKAEVERLMKIARLDGYKIHMPITFDALKFGRYHGDMVKKIHVDNAESLLQLMVDGIPIETMAVSTN